MTENKKTSLSQIQMSTRPKINDVIGDVLSGNKLTIALDFIQYLKDKKLNLVWASANSWSVKYKGNVILWIKLTGAEVFTNRKNIEDGSWLITPPFNIKGDFKDLQSNKQFKEIIWANVNYCVGCMYCKPGNTYKILGNEFNNVCNIMVHFINPGADEIDCVKQLLEHCIKTYEMHGTAKHPLLDPSTNGLIRLNNATDINVVTGTDGAASGNLFNLKYAMFHSRGNCDIMFKTNEPITLKMYGLVTYKEDKLPNSWTLCGTNSEDGIWDLLDTRIKADEFPESITFYAEKAFKINAPGSYQYYKLTLEGKGVFMLSQIHLYIK